MYDYVVVGAGSAGCVLAARLTEDPDVRVLLLEAGGSDRRDEIMIPAAIVKNFKTARDWAFTTEPQKHLQGRGLYCPRGKVLGGTASINAMIYIRGNRRDYDSWRDLGNPGWGFDDVLPYFKRAENQERGASEFHGVGGPLNVADQRSPHRFSHAFVEACAQAGIPRITDFNAAEQDGSGLYQVTQRRGRRHSASEAYLHPAMNRPNLTVEIGAFTHRVLFEGQRAVGVAYRQAGRTVRARAERQVMLCGGAVNSPQLLLLSGVGPAHHLREHGLEVVVDLPGVGQNLHDHPVIGVHQYSPHTSLIDAEKPRHLAHYLARRRGPLTSNVGEGGAFIRTREGLDAPDLQYHFAPAIYYNHGLREAPGHGFTLGATLVDVESRGRISLRSSDPSWAPAIEPNYLESETDMEALLVGLERGREIIGQPAFDWARGPEYLPGAGVTTDGELRNYIRAEAETLYHPVGTCRMGIDDLAVVDPELRVHQVEGLRVVDASVMPTVPRGNTNAPTIMIAERAADLIRR
jgi:choline dehydrogenase